MARFGRVADIGVPHHLTQLPQFGLGYNLFGSRKEEKTAEIDQRSFCFQHSGE